MGNSAHPQRARQSVVSVARRKLIETHREPLASTRTGRYADQRNPSPVVSRLDGSEQGSYLVLYPTEGVLQDTHSIHQLTTAKSEIFSTTKLRRVAFEPYQTFGMIFRPVDSRPADRLN